MSDSLTGEIKRWHICGCIDIELPDGKEVTLPCLLHKNAHKETQKKEFTLQKALLETLAKDVSEEKPQRLSKDEWL